jgi:hypothetical protein
VWTASCFPSGYAQFWLNGTNRRAHRVSYEWEVGPINAETLDHLCGAVNCVRPSHLDPVSQKENLARGKGNPSKTTCPRGHPYDTVRERDGARICSICERHRQREQKRRQRAARGDEINAQRRANYAAKRSA